MPGLWGPVLMLGGSVGIPRAQCWDPGLDPGKEGSIQPVDQPWATYLAYKSKSLNTTGLNGSKEGERLYHYPYVIDKELRYGKIQGVSTPCPHDCLGTESPMDAPFWLISAKT